MRDAHTKYVRPDLSLPVSGCLRPLTYYVIRRYAAARQGTLQRLDATWLVTRGPICILGVFWALGDNLLINMNGLVNPDPSFFHAQ